MLQHEAWFHTASPRSQEFWDAVRANDLGKVKLLLGRLGIDLKAIAQERVAEDVPSHYERPGTAARFERAFMIESPKIDVRWDRSWMQMRSAMERWPPDDRKISGIWVDGTTDFNLEVTVGEDLVEQGAALIDEDRDQGSSRRDVAFTTEHKWRQFLQESIKETWGKQSTDDPSRLDRVLMLAGPKAISDPVQGFEIQYDEWYALKWLVPVRAVWSERIQWGELGL